MAKPKSGRCVHCLKVVDAITKDHLFPKSWYPDGTPQELERWTVPACGRCNAEYGKIESELLLQLAACLDPKSEAAKGLWPKVKDSLTPEKGRSPFDSRMREMKRRKFLKSLRPAEGAPMDHVLPEINPDRPKGTLALSVSSKGLHRFVEKLVRGTVYLTERRYIENKNIGMSFLRPDDGKEIYELLEQFGALYERGPAIRIRKAVAQEAATDPLFSFELWNQIRVYAYVEDIVGHGV